jgi:uncharacterized protein (TIGR03083 family)
MDDAAVWDAVSARRRQVVTLLRDLTPQEWEQPSLCEGWTVREVAAHLAMAEASLGSALVAFVRAGGRMNRMIHDTAVRRAAQRSTTEVVDEIAATIGSRRTAPTVTCREALLDVLVHGADMAIPLDRPLPMDPQAAAEAATRAWSYGRRMAVVFRAPPRTAADGQRLVATDVDWARGDGPECPLPIEAILLSLTGRSVAVAD